MRKESLVNFTLTGHIEDKKKISLGKMAGHQPDERKDGGTRSGNDRKKAKVAKTYKG